MADIIIKSGVSPKKLILGNTEVKKLLEILNAEIEARGTADDKLQTAIDAETQLRVSGDNSILEYMITFENNLKDELYGAISDEALTRDNKDLSLEEYIDNVGNGLTEEIIAREYADEELQTSIDKKQDKVQVLYDKLAAGGAIPLPESYNHILNLSNCHNREMRVEYLVNALKVTIPDSVYPDDFITSLSFTSYNGAPEVSYSATGIINWVGTDCSIVDEKSIFAPKANTRYDIVIYFNGVQFVGLVNGFVPATINNSGQTEETTS